MSGLSSIVTNPCLILLLICHLLSDYYFQSQKMADRKDQDKKVLGLHIPSVIWTCGGFAWSFY